MPLSSQQINAANELVTQNRIVEALTICQVQEASFLRDYRLVGASWSDLTQRETMGVMRADDLQIERNKVIDRLLRLLTFESAPAWKHPQSLLTRSRLPYTILAFCLMTVVVICGWYFRTKPVVFPTVFAGYILSEHSLAPISSATVRLVDKTGIELPSRTIQADVNGYWIIKATEAPKENSKLIFTTRDCPAEHYEFYLSQLREHEDSSDELSVFTVSIDC